MLVLAGKLTNALLTVTAATDQISCLDVTWPSRHKSKLVPECLEAWISCCTGQTRQSCTAFDRNREQPLLLFSNNHVSCHILAFSALDFPSSPIGYEMCCIADQGDI